MRRCRNNLHDVVIGTGKCRECKNIAQKRAARKYQDSPQGKARLNRWNRHLRRKKKTLLVEMFGGKCLDCGYGAHWTALQFDHRDPAQKKFTISGGAGVAKAWNVLVEEARKCDLVCANCHAIRTFMQHEDRIQARELSVG